MNPGDIVFVTERGELRFLSREEHGRRGHEDTGDARMVGTVVDVRDPPEDSIIQLEPPEPNMVGPTTTLATLREKFG